MYYLCYQSPDLNSPQTWCQSAALSYEDWQSLVVLFLHFCVFLLFWLALHLFYKSLGG
jgi:hypothetical protein